MLATILDIVTLSNEALNNCVVFSENQVARFLSHEINLLPTPLLLNTFPCSLFRRISRHVKFYSYIVPVYDLGRNWSKWFSSAGSGH